MSTHLEKMDQKPSVHIVFFDKRRGVRGTLVPRIKLKYFFWGSTINKNNPSTF